MLLATSLALVVLACDRDDASDGGLTLFAAASLRAVTGELEAAWLEVEPGVPLTIATEASNVLAAQIEEGAVADVFIAADDVQAQRLAAEGLTAAEPVAFAANEITLVARPDGPLTEVAGLAEPGIRLIVGGPATPIGRYTAEAIDRLARLMPEPAAFAGAVEANIASREDNVRAALAKVELGEGDAAFVYRTDAAASEDTVEIALPAAVRVRAPYQAVRLSEAADAETFLSWLGSPAAVAILEDAGFEVGR